MKRLSLSQPWIYSAFVDLLFILSPPFFSLLVVLLFPSYFQQTIEMPAMTWFVLVLLIDVAHVYSTLYRTYFDQETWITHRSALVNIPLLAWIAGVLLYSTDKLFFWRVLAYLAVFHFIRQQYGFMKIYSRKESRMESRTKLPTATEPTLFQVLSRRIDSFAIYYATIYPLLFWHLHPDRNFHWFVQGDFFLFESNLPLTWLANVALGLYVLMISVYVAKEGILIAKTRTVNLPRNLVVLGTLASWYFGIVYFNGDMAFTITNVVSHGIPYMALIWIYGRKKYYPAPKVKAAGKPVAGLVSKVFSTYGLLVFLLIIFGLAYVEEAFWDRLFWKEHPELFSLFSGLPTVSDDLVAAFLVPLLALPQITHYFIDGFIWKLSGDKVHWKRITLDQPEGQAISSSQTIL